VIEWLFYQPEVGVDKKTPLLGDHSAWKTFSPNKGSHKFKRATKGATTQYKKSIADTKESSKSLIIIPSLQKKTTGKAKN